MTPKLSVIIPTFNNEGVIRRCIESWRGPAVANDVELIVIEDGCRDGTPAFLERESATDWGCTHLRWIHMDDAHELRCTNAGLAVARAPLATAWQDDMFVLASWFVPELIKTFERHADIGLLSLSRGLTLHPAPDAIETWDDLVDWRRLRSTIGPFPFNWFRIQEVDAVIRPWIVRRACLDRVGPLDARGNPVGGNATAIVNLELRFPIWKWLGGAVFVDSGTVTPEIAGLGLDAFRTGVGGGLRIKTPVGPIRFDVGYALSPIPDESRTQFYVTVGNPF